MSLPPCPAPFNMAAHVLQHARTAPDKIALEVLGDAPERWTYAALARAVGGVASGLLEMGLRPGDRVVIRLGHSVDVPLVHLAALAVDLVPIPVSSQLTAAELTPMARHVAPALVVQDPALAAPDIAAPVVGPDRLAAWRSLPPAAFAMGDPDRPGYIVFTSGTTKTPRAVLHAHRAVWARQAMIRDWADMRATDRVLHAGAFNWTYTMGTGLMDPWTVGATALIAAPPARPDALGVLLSAARATIFAAAPGVYRQMLRHPVPELPDLRHGLCAGEKLTEPLRDAWRAATGTDLHEAFGQSECSTFISGAPHGPAPPDTLGRAQGGRAVAVLGLDGPLSADTPGELAIRADDPGLMLGYLGDPAATAERHRDGWFLTGDRGQIDRDGWVRYLGRMDDLLNAGGFRVSPLEIEAVAESFPDLREAAAITREVRAGVSVIALCYAADRALDETALARHCEARLARYKQPRVFERVDALPRSANGKLMRRALAKTDEDRP
ncbi:acyl--CoA ligase [Maribius pontilimi]|uniref:Acyl--CoA ligase n=1 Tax=Palleronia pontilimi TaxID=1964209 RepID=A0A934MH33_9RHOB|nr:class I adenylate-forming enzyme family protein [Palleronia pontilimi]MBJ3762964.1 acyl--CoA ligase [Palleronia pontilimi]